MSFNDRTKVIAIIVAAAAALTLGIVLDNVGGDRFTVQKRPAEALPVAETNVPTDDIPKKGVIIDGKININKADAATLQTIDGIGESIAKRIVKYRDQYGDFITVEELLNISGIGDAKLDDIRDDICVGP